MKVEANIFCLHEDYKGIELLVRYEILEEAAFPAEKHLGYAADEAGGFRLLGCSRLWCLVKCGGRDWDVAEVVT